MNPKNPQSQGLKSVKTTAADATNLVPKTPTLDMQAVSAQLQEIRAELPMLAKNDQQPQQRLAQLQSGQNTYAYDYSQIPGVAMLKTLPFKEYPTFEWISQVGETVLAVIWNQELASLEFEGRAWMQFFDRSLTDNIEFLKVRVKSVFDMIFNETLTPKSGQKYHELKQLFQGWKPQDMQELDQIVSTFSQMLPHMLMTKVHGPSHKLTDYAQLFKGISLPPVASRFQSDITFGYYRVAGPNPTSIKNAPAHWNELVPLTAAQFNAIKGYENINLNQAFIDNRLFLLEYPYLNLLVPSDFPVGQKYIGDAKGIFYRDDFGKLMPVAIRCSSKDTLVFTPSDGYAWEMAKNMLQVADSNYHELVAHLGHTHLVEEAFVIASHRQFATSHPVFKLLAPHFEGTAFINWAAKEFLVAKGNFVDKLLAGTIESSQAVVAKSVKEFQFNHKMPDQDFKNRGVDMTEIVYPYRDDALMVWSAINQWVGSYLDLFYQDNQAVVDDTELQAFAQEVVAQDGGRIADFGETADGRILTKAYLTRALSMIIFTASAQHAAVNFPQADMMTFVPSMPLSAYTPAPVLKQQSRKQWLAQFAPMDMASEQLAILHTLGGVHYTTLGQYEHHYFKDERVPALVETLQLQLSAIQQQIATRNAVLVQQGLLPYEYLSPQNIPQSINI